jgi:hypothetical protein
LIQDRVRRTWGSGRALDPGLVRTPLLFGVSFLVIWLWAEGIFYLVTLRWGPGWEAIQFSRWLGDWRLLDLMPVLWSLLALFFLIAAAGALLEVGPVRLDPARGRSVGLGACLLLCSASSIIMLLNWPGSGPREFVLDAESSFEKGWSTGAYAYAVMEDLPGARNSCHELLVNPDPARRAWGAAALISSGIWDVKVRRALRSGFDETVAELEDACDRSSGTIADLPPRVHIGIRRLEDARDLFVFEGRCPNLIVVTYRSVDWRHRVESLGAWWRENRERLSGNS